MASERVHREIVRLAHCGLDLCGFTRRASRTLRRAVPFDGVCVLTLDPATLLPTGEVVENGLPEAATARLTEIELREPDLNKFRDLAESRLPAASLSGATEGKLDRSARHRELKRPHGFGDELRAVLADATGTWGALTLLRETGRANFTPREVRLVGSLSRPLAEGLRRAVLFADLSREDAGESNPGAGLLLLGDDYSIDAANSAATAWLAELRDGGSDKTLPPVIQAVASQARAASLDAGQTATARMRAPSGRWLTARGSVLGDGLDARIAVTLEAAGSPELAPLIADAHGLTERERLVTQLVARGLATDAIGNRLHLSPYTVQDHLKSVFAKVGVSSRGELVARLFFEHGDPRLFS